MIISKKKRIATMLKDIGEVKIIKEKTCLFKSQVKKRVCVFKIYVRELVLQEYFYYLVYSKQANENHNIN